MIGFTAGAMDKISPKNRNESKYKFRKSGKGQKYYQKYKEENKERLKEYYKQFNLKNKERISKRRKKHRLEHRDEMNAKARIYNQEHREELRQGRMKRKDKIREYNLKRKYNITDTQYNELLVKQNDSCAVCLKFETSKDKSQNTKPLSVDHDHLTGKVRGLLCNNCNRGLGNFNDDVHCIERAKKYILKNSEKIIGFTCGQYDICHAGHYIAFKEIRSQCSRLVVGLQKDASLDRPEKNKPIQTLEERLIQLNSCRWIDEVVVYERESDLINLLKDLKPDIRFLGEDHKGKPFTGDNLPIEIYYNSRKHNYSSSSLRERIKNGN